MPLASERTMVLAVSGPVQLIVVPAGTNGHVTSESPAPPTKLTVETLGGPPSPACAGPSGGGAASGLGAATLLGRAVWFGAAAGMIAAVLGAPAGVGEAAGLEVAAGLGAATAMIEEDFGAAAGVGVAAGLGAAAAVPGSDTGLDAAAGIVVAGAGEAAGEGAAPATGVAAWLGVAGGLLAESSRLAAAGLVVIRCGAARTLVAAGLGAAGKPILTGRGAAACLLVAVFELVPAGLLVAGVEVLRPRDSELLLSEPPMNVPPASPNTNAAATSATTSHVDSFRSPDLSTVWRASSRAPGRLEVIRSCSPLTWALPVACRAAGKAKSASSASHAPRTNGGRRAGLVRSVTLNIAASQP